MTHIHHTPAPSSSSKSSSSSSSSSTWLRLRLLLATVTATVTMLPGIMALNTTSSRVCVSLPTASVCSSVLSYTHVMVDRTTAGASCTGTSYENTTNWVESHIAATFPNYWAALQEPCRSNMAAFMCQQAYPPCGGAPPCDTRCVGTASSCSPLDVTLIYPTLMPPVVANPVIPSSAACSAYSKPPNGTTTTCVAEPAGYTSSPQYPRCETYRGSFCSGVIDYPIYVPRNMAQDVVEAQLMGLDKLKGLARVTNGCLNSFVTTFCLTAFPRCDDGLITSPVPLKTPFPHLACRSVCTDFYDKCSDSVVQFIPTSFLPNCTSQGQVAPGPSYVCGNKTSDALDDYPPKQSAFGVIANIPLITQCNSWSDTQLQSLSINVTCPAPLVTELVTDMRQICIIVPGAMCNLPCNGHIQFTDSEWRSFGRFSVGMSVVSFILGSFLFWTWLCIPSKRKQRNTLYFNFCVMMISFFILVGFMGGKEPKNVGCKTAAQAYMQQDPGYCAFQGVAAYYFAFASIWWWTVIAIDLFIAIIVLPKRTDRQATIMSITYHAIAWGVPMLSVIILASRQAFGGGTIQTFCWIGNTTLASWEIWAFFVIPFAVLVLIGYLCMISIMIVMARSSANSKIRRNWKKYIRPILFMMQFGVLFTLAFSFYIINLRKDYDRIAKSQAEFVTCLFTPDGTQDNCGVDGHEFIRVDTNWWYAGHFAIMGQGLINFITYGTQWTNFVEWKKFIIAVFTGMGMSYQTSQGDTSSHKTDPSNKSNRGDKSARSYLSAHSEGTTSAPHTARGDDPNKRYFSDETGGAGTNRRQTQSRTTPRLHGIEMTGAGTGTGTGVALSPDVPGRLGRSVSRDSDSMGDLSLSHAPTLIHHLPSSSSSSALAGFYPQPTPSPARTNGNANATTEAPIHKTSRAHPPLPPSYPPPGRSSGSTGSATNFV